MLFICFFTCFSPSQFIIIKSEISPWQGVNGIWRFKMKKSIVFVFFIFSIFFLEAKQNKLHENCGDAEYIENLLQTGEFNLKGLQAHDSNGNTPVHKALLEENCLASFTVFLNYMKQKNFNLDAIKNKKGQTLLKIAIKNNKIAQTALLLATFNISSRIIDDLYGKYSTEEFKQAVEHYPVSPKPGRIRATSLPAAALFLENQSRSGSRQSLNKSPMPPPRPSRFDSSRSSSCASSTDTTSIDSYEAGYLSRSEITSSPSSGRSTISPPLPLKISQKKRNPRDPLPLTPREMQEQEERRKREGRESVDSGNPIYLEWDNK